MTNTTDPPRAGLPREKPAQNRPPSDAAGIAEIARGSTLNLGGAAVSAVATLGVTVLVARAFSRPAAGAFFTATSLFLIVEMVAGLGAYNGLVYFIPRLRASGDEHRTSEMLRKAILPVIVTSVAGAALLLAFAEPLARAMLAGHQSTGASPATVANALRALAAALPFAVLLDTLLGATRGYRDMRPTVALDRICRSVLQLLAVVVAALLGAAALLAPLWALAYIPPAAVAWIWLRRIRRRARANTGPHRRGPAGSDAGPRRFWLFTLPRALALGAQQVIQRLDIVLVAIMRGPVDAAIYTAATRFLVVGQLGNQAISMAAQPQLSRQFGLSDRVGAGTVYKTTTAWLVLLTWPLYLLAISFGPVVLSIFGHSYHGGSDVIIVLGAAALLASACGQVDVVLTSTGRSALSLANGLTALGVNVGVDLILIPRYGIIGAAIGWAAAIVAANLIPLAQLAWIVRIHPFGRATITACALTAVSFGVIPFLVRVLLGDGVAAQILAVAAGCAALGVGLWRGRNRLQLSMIPRPRIPRGGFAPRGLRKSDGQPEIT
ncbi:MAG TPA: lipopolysaccharide biosynthesis protein [Solirubrobacteraceae bacterium]|nr:lipopolysaccharide biosynthesis protein [Solirubrobacteraceae bacterium]